MPLIALIAILVLAIVGIGFAIFLRLRSGRPGNDPSATPASDPGLVQTVTVEPEPTSLSPIANMLDATPAPEIAATEATATDGQEAIPDDVHIEVTDLSVNNSLPSEWKNILLLGADDRHVEYDYVRTDAIIVCSINSRTGQVKLSSVLRDLAVDYNLDENHTLYRINAAYTFGGPELAMKTVNQLFNLNIEDYVFIDFFGFQEIAYQLGGVDITITEAEMHSINHNVIEQAKIARRAGIDDTDMPFEELVNYGENTHLDGRQALAYARIRKLDSDISRTERQRIVLNALAQKLRGKDAVELTTMALSMLKYVRTNLTVEEIISVAATVLSRNLDIQQTYVPITGTYAQETRNGEAMLYDCNYSENAAHLYKFIYGQ